MNRMLVFLAGGLIAASCSAATNDADGRAAELGPPTSTATNSPVEEEFQGLLRSDDAAQEEVDKWIQENQQFAGQGAGVSDADLNRRIKERFEPVRKGYQDFIRRYPNHSRARVAYASFLGDMHDEEGAREQLEYALKFDTNNPAIYNNLANIYGHIGPEVKKAFEFYGKAIALNPAEPVYYHNFGTTVYLFRKDAREFYQINEQQVFDKAFALYSNALRLDPTNFPLASDVAQSYYGVKPLRTEDALRAWTNALKLAHDDIERQGVYIHLARIKLLSGRYGEAREQLAAVTDEMYADLRKRVVRSLEEREKEAAQTNAAAGK